MMVANLAIGFITPPLGVNLFVTCGIADISLDEMSQSHPAVDRGHAGGIGIDCLVPGYLIGFGKSA